MMNTVKLARYALAGWVPGGARQCVMCGHRIWRFMPYLGGSAHQPELMRALDVVGSNPDCFECPRCGAHDRERHLLMYLEKTGLLAGIMDTAVLHFAPEKHLAQRIVDAAPALYVAGDLYPTGPQTVRVDVLKMQFDDQSFDLVIANHVLEHVSDDFVALIEIHRVLKPGGYAVLQTPYSRKLHQTWDDAGITDDAARLQAFGQSDHVRLYGRDIFTRFAATGMVSCVRTHQELLADVDATITGVNIAEPFFLFQKPG